MLSPGTNGVARGLGATIVNFVVIPTALTVFARLDAVLSLSEVLARVFGVWRRVTQHAWRDGLSALGASAPSANQLDGLTLSALLLAASGFSVAARMLAPPKAAPDAPVRRQAVLFWSAIVALLIVFIAPYWPFVLDILAAYGQRMSAVLGGAGGVATGALLAGVALGLVVLLGYASVAPSLRDVGRRERLLLVCGYLAGLVGLIAFSPFVESAVSAAHGGAELATNLQPFDIGRLDTRTLGAPLSFDAWGAVTTLLLAASIFTARIAAWNAPLRVLILGVAFVATDLAARLAAPAVDYIGGLIAGG